MKKVLLIIISMCVIFSFILPIYAVSRINESSSTGTSLISDSVTSKNLITGDVTQETFTYNSKSNLRSYGFDGEYIEGWNPNKE